MQQPFLLIYPLVIFLSGVATSGEQQGDYFTQQTPQMIHGIDVSLVQDIDRVDAMELPIVTDSSGKPLFTGLYSGPYFDFRRMAKNLTVQIGENALMSCAVKQTGGKAVSWIRKSDSYILSVDSSIFISDERFKVLRPHPSSEWNLHIKSVQKTDEGIYECQISTEPKMSFDVHLKVIVPEVKIEGGPDIHAQAGSSVTLKCSITDALQRPNSVNWYHDGSLLQSKEWHIQPFVKASKQSKSSKLATATAKSKFFSFESTVSIDEVDSRHSGQYECHPDELKVVSINLHVVKGGTLAAMSDDRNDNTSDANSNLNSLAHVLIYLVALWWIR